MSFAKLCKQVDEGSRLKIALQLTLNSFDDMRNFMLAKFLEHKQDFIKQDFVDFSWRFVITFGDKVFFDFFFFVLLWISNLNSNVILQIVESDTNQIAVRTTLENA